jgi:malonyl-CoA/methylmalonyl-CoA synthetase
MAEVSEDGYYTLLGRKSDLIISGGFNIYPRELEDFLLEQEEVAEAAVAGQPDPIRGEVPVAYIVARKPFDPAELESRCRRVFASFKIPRGFIALETLPRTALGKVQKHLLPPWKL